MKVGSHTVVSFHYRLADTQGNTVETSHGGDPVAALHGAGNVIPGVEAALNGREAGERFSVTLSPEQGYGARRDGLVQRVSKKLFRDSRHIKAGVSTTLTTREGTRAVIVLKVGSSVVDVDLNHPLAGKTLLFEIEVIEVRQASAEEIAHGHAHAPGGHKH